MDLESAFKRSEEDLNMDDGSFASYRCILLIVYCPGAGVFAVCFVSTPLEEWDRKEEVG